MKKISSIKSFFQRLFVWIFTLLKTVDSALPSIKKSPLIVCDHSPEGERVLLVRAAKNFELKKRGEK